MPPRKNAGPPTNITPIIIGVGFIGMAVAFYFQFPGVGVMLLALMFAGWSSIPPIFTGKKDSQGRPTAIDDNEKRMMNSYRFWSDVKWRLLVPNSDWLPGMNSQRPQRAIEHLWTPNLVWVIASALGVLALGIPVRGPVELLGGAPNAEMLFRLIDGFALFSILTVTTTSARRNFTPDDPRPGITLKDAMGHLGTPKGLPLFFAGGVASGIAAMAVLVYGETFGLGSLIAPLPVPVFAVAAFFLIYSLVLFLGARTDALEHWRLVASKRPEWEQRWAPVLKSNDEAPRLVDFEQVGFFEVSTFDASASMGYSGILSMEAKIAPALGAGRMATILSSPDIDSSGQPMPGTINPRRFRVVTYPSDEMVDFTDVNADPKVIEIGADVAMMRVIVANGLGRPVFMDISPAFTVPDPVEVEDEHEEDEPEGEPSEKRKWWQRRPKVAEQQPIEQPVYTAAWLAHWAVPNGPPFSFLADYAEDIGGEAGTEVTIDKRTGDIFFGALTADSTPWTNPANAKRVKNIALDNVWYRRWKNVFQGKIEFIPRREAEIYSEMKVGDIPIYRQPFSMGQGVELKQYDRLEDKLAIALDSAPMVAITGFKAQGDRDGARHPQGMCVVWSPSAMMPSSPEKLKPGSRATANEWVLTWMLNRAFDHTKRLARPEIISAKSLTSPDSSSHIWEMKLRLYGGVTLEEVRAQSERIRQSMASQWIRIVEDTYGCTIAVGVKPSAPGVKLSNPRTADRIAELDWEYAFAISGVSGHGGILPKMVKRSTMEKNKNVSILDFSLPPGCDIEDVKKVAGKLSTATENAFLQISQTSDPKVIRILVAERNPLEKSYAPDWDEIDESDGIPFATGVDGASMTFSPKKTPHCLVSGLSGGGKFQGLRSVIPVPMSSKYPGGWATIGSLEVGDKLYSTLGEIIEVTELHPVHKRRMYEVSFSDGQTERVSEGHLWKVSSAASRQANSKSAARVRAHRGVSDSAVVRAARVARLRQIASEYTQGQTMLPGDLSRLAGVGASSFYDMVPPSLGVDSLVPMNRRERVYHGAELAALWSEGQYIGGRPIEQHAIDSLSAMENVSVRAATAILVERDPSRGERDRMKERVLRHGVIPSGTGTGVAVLPLYPVDETLNLIASHLENALPGVMPLETIVSTDEMMSAILDPRGTTHETLNWAVRVADAIPGEDIDLTVPGYTLGAWLGDGHSKDGAITSMDETIIREVENDGYTMRRSESRSGDNRASTYFFDGLFADLQAILDRSAKLKTRGSLDKRIPARYLRASVETRLAVLQGLMDTDGTIGKAGSCELGLSKHDLALDALELIRSLGIKAAITEKNPTYTHGGERKEGATHYRIKFTTTMPVFRLRRKSERLPSSVRETQRWNYVTGIREVEAESGRCISVSGDDRTYLTGGFIPTHNSVLVQTLVYGALVRDWDLVVIDPVKGGADFKFAEGYIRAMAVEKDDYFAASGLMKMIYAEVARRVKMNSKHGVGSFADLPEDIRPRRIFVIIDEFTSAIEAEKVPPRSDDAELEAERDAIIALNNAKLFIAQYTGKILREARSAGITVIMATQKLSAKSLDAVPGGETMKMQLSRILLGNATFGDKMSALRKPEQSPDLGSEVPPGRGIYEPSDGSPQIIQAWYSPTHIFRERLEEIRPPFTEAERAAWDYTAFVSRPSDGADEEELQIPDAFDSFGDDFEFTGFTGEEEDAEAEGVVGEEIAFSLDEIVEVEGADFNNGFDDSFGDGEFVPDDPEFSDDTQTSVEPVVVLPEPVLPVVGEDDGFAVAAAVTPEVDSASGGHGAVFFVDADGVIAPFRPNDRTAEQDVPGIGIVHIDVGAALRISSLPADPVYLTDWERSQVTDVFAPMLGHDVGYAPNEGGEEYWWKIESILRYIDDHPQTTSVIWADDLMGEEDEVGITRREQFMGLMEMLDIPALTVQTESNEGLTEANWLSIEGFLGISPATQTAREPEPEAIDLFEGDPEDEIDFSEAVALPAPTMIEDDDPFADVAAPRVVRGRVGNTGEIEGEDAP